MPKVGLAPIERRTAEARAVESLRDAIVSGALPQGTRVTEIDLANKTNISRATVRAALHVLATEGLVNQVPYTGWSIVQLGPDDLWELFTLRASLESLAGRMTARVLTSSAKEILEAALSDLADACRSQGPASIADADFRLHETIVHLSNHRRLEDAYRLMKQQVRLYINVSDAVINDPKAIIAQHEPIIAAILARDEDLADHLSREHHLNEGAALVERARRAEQRNAASS